MNTFLDNSPRMSSFTDLRVVFDALGGRQREFNWLLTDLVHYPEVFVDHHNNARAAFWLSGEELTAIVEATDSLFWWGVLSGFRPGVEIDLAHLEVYPIADMNQALWLPEVGIQHPKAEVEIVCWDSAYTMLLSHDDDLTHRFRAYFPEAVDFNEYNRRLAKKRGLI